MKRFKRVLAVASSVALMASASITAFAAAPTSTAGTANVLAYSLESVVVPTAIKVALNPQTYAVTTKDGVTSSAQVVSFNYGIANLSTADKDVTVTFNVTGTADSEKTAITFVDSAAKATFGAGDDNAKDGELKMYLAVVGSTAAPTTSADAAFAAANEAHNATADNLGDVKMTAASGGEVAFVKGDGENYANAKIAFKLGKSAYAVADGQTVDFTTTQALLAEKMKIKTLGDVTGFTIKGTMNTGADWTKADVTALTFTPVYAVADVTGTEVATTDGGYKQINTAPATYVVTYTANYTGAAPATVTESVEVGSNPTGVSEDITALKAGNEGYTFAGWYDAAEGGNAVTVTELTAAKTVYAHWTLTNVGPSISPSSYDVTNGSGVDVDVDLGTGSLAATSITSITYKNANNLDRTMAASDYSFENGKISITASVVSGLYTNNVASRVYTVTFDNNATATFTLVAGN